MGLSTGEAGNGFAGDDVSVQWVSFGNTVNYGASSEGPWFADPWTSLVINPWVRVGIGNASVAQKLVQSTNKVVRGYRLVGTATGAGRGTVLQVLSGIVSPSALAVVPETFSNTPGGSDARKFRLESPSTAYPYGVLSLSDSNNFRYPVYSTMPLAWRGPAEPGGANVPRVKVSVLELALGDLPTAEISLSKASTPTGDSVTCKVSLQYPGGNDPVVGVAVTLSADAKCDVATAGGFYRGTATAVTDATGVASFTVRGVSSGSATVTATLEATSPEVFVTPWPLTTTLAVDAAPVAPKAGTCTTYPAVPGVPGTPGQVFSEPSNTWDAGANSVVELDGDVRLKFVTPHAVGAVVGLTGTRDAVGSYTRMSHAFYFHYTMGGRPVCQAMEHGEAVTHEAAHNADSEFSIERVNGEVSYYVDDVLLHRSTLTSEGVVSAGCALYSSGDRVPS